MIEILHMNNGESIIAEVIHRSPDETIVRMPMRMDSMEDTYEDVYFTKLTDLLLYSDDTDMVITNSNILCIVSARDSVQRYYNRAVHIAIKTREALDSQLERFFEAMDTVQLATVEGNNTRH